jgi:Flp pilus assembly protein protease CpaA
VIERVFKNRKTTALGLFILVISFVLVWFDKATLTEVSLFLTGGFAMLFIKDPVIKKDANN